ncbi:hypothetical protein B0H14DRAFT_3463968 [Mycena olivaceomarginata]|nr:hypothetical protein B0H14DRAFT_3463968 [Mycena olivaceomarginata]
MVQIGAVDIGNYSNSDSAERDNHGAVGYPSPSSTVSPGFSLHLSGNSTVSMSNLSELNYALRNKHQDHRRPGRSTFFFDSNNNSYPRPAPATSDSSTEFADKFQYDYGMSAYPFNV